MWMDPANGRWVCVRCFESNEANADVCAKCGLERGSDPAAAAAAPAEPGATPPAPDGMQPVPAAPGGNWTAAPAPGPQRPMWLQLVLRFWWIGVIVIVGAVSWYVAAKRDDSGQITNAGDMQITDVRVGDCFDLKDPTEQEVDDVTAKPCTEPHAYEMYHVGDLPDGEFPSDVIVDAWIEGNCIPAFADYVGLDYQSSTLAVMPVTPTEGSWNEGDHSVQCVLADPAEPQLTESLKDSAR